MICPNCKGACFAAYKGRISSCKRCGGKGQVEVQPAVAPPAPTPSYQIALVGEAWGEDEERMGMPFVGASGRELSRMLEEAEIDITTCYKTNVFNLRPKPTNDVKNLGTIKALSSVPLPEMTKGVYLQDQYYPEVQRLWKELKELRPNLIIALGNTALWALTGSYGIKGVRGTVVPATLCDNLKVLPTWHPAFVLRSWETRAVVVADFMKAKRQALFPEIRRPARELWVEPSLNHIELFFNSYVLGKTKRMAFDIETVGDKQITSIGFAPSRIRAINIPFVDNRKPSGSYWSSALEERLAWQWVARYLSAPDIEKIGQNTLYDINWLWHKIGLTPTNYSGDTMLKHHAWNPEMEKGLGFLGSVYSDEPAWKLMRKPSSIKKGE